MTGDCGLTPERLVRPSTTLVKLAKELDVVQTQAVDGGAERAQHQVERVNENGDDDPDDDVAQTPGQVVGDAGEVHGRQPDGGDTQIGEDVPHDADELDGAHEQPQPPERRAQQDDADDQHGDAGRHERLGQPLDQHRHDQEQPDQPDEHSPALEQVIAAALPHSLPYAEDQSQRDVAGSHGNGEQQQA